VSLFGLTRAAGRATVSGMKSYEDSIRAAMDAAHYPSKRERLVLHQVVCARMGAQLRAAGASDQQVEAERAQWNEQFQALDAEFEHERDFGQRLGFGRSRYAAEQDGDPHGQISNRMGRSAVNLIIILAAILLVGYLFNR
jgi:hypothetical protein